MGRSLAFLSLLFMMMLMTACIPEQKTVLDFPIFEQNAGDVEHNGDEVLKKANADLSRMAQLSPEEITFANTAGALDTIFYEVSNVQFRLDLLAVTSLDKGLQEKAEEVVVKISQWFIEVQSREDIYKALQLCAEKYPQLKGEDKRLLDTFIRDYRRMGFQLSADEQKLAISLRKEIAALESEISSNIKKTNSNTVTLTPDDVRGIPESDLKRLTQDSNGNYLIRVGIQSEVEVATKFSPNEEVRKRVFTSMNSRAQEENIPLINKVLKLKAQLAQLLGYKNWADYRIEVKMAQSGDKARTFISNLSERLRPKFEKELTALKELKIRETGDQTTEIHPWDMARYQQKYLQSAYQLDLEGLKRFFELENTMKGMFQVYEKIFKIKIVPIKAPYVWAEEVRVIRIDDAISGKELGILYMDLYPRPEYNKYGHFAMFTIRSGKKLDDGTYRRPVSALVCNFPRPMGGTPSLLSLRQVETLFHEFGHALHSLLTQSNYATFAGTNVVHDFVESPSQLLEHWVLDKDVLDLFARDYQNPEEKIPANILSRIKESKVATAGCDYSRQFAFGLLDLKIHQDVNPQEDFDVVGETNKILSNSYLTYPEGSSFITSFGHLFGGYDAGYYGYAWADSLAADLGSIFEASPNKFLDEEIGYRLRKEIYEQGASRDENESIEAFLQRKPSIEPFLKQIGLD